MTPHWEAYAVENAVQLFFRERILINLLFCFLFFLKLLIVGLRVLAKLLLGFLNLLLQLFEFCQQCTILLFYRVGLGLG